MFAMKCKSGICSLIATWCFALLIHGVFSSIFKTERPPYEDFLNYGIKKMKPGPEKENEIIKSKVEVLGQVLKKHVDKLRKSPGQNVELVFLVDSSASVGAENFFNELKFVKKLLADFTVSYNQTRVAVVTFSSRGKVIRHIDHVTQASAYNHKCSLLGQELPRIRYSGGGTYTLGAILEAQSVLALSRNEATKAVFLITDGYSNGGDPRSAAEFLKNRGVIIFTFGIQNGNVKELYDMASEPKEEHSYILNSFQEFEALARRALHEDLRSGSKLTQNSRACATLCIDRRDCCDTDARCTCGTHTGDFACTCRRGFYGTGLQGGCMPCPMGAYRDTEGPSDITSCTACPDPHMLSPQKSTSIRQCYCKRGYVQYGLKCKRRECPTLEPPKNGYFIRGTCEKVVNAACGVRCHPGYSLEGVSIRLCREDGTWTGDDATCVMKTCQKLKPPINGEMSCSSHSATIDTQCNFSCDPGYQLVGSRIRTCLPVAMWDGIRAYCKPIFCLPLSPQINGFIKPMSCTKGKIKFGTTCEYGCDPGYRLKGPFKTTCRDKGAWSGPHDKVRCVDIDPPIIRCPQNIEAKTEPNENFALVSWDPPVAKDSANGDVYVTTTPATQQPMKLKIGQHSIYFIAKDEWGNKAKCVMKVTVKDEESPRIDRCESPPTFLSREIEVDVYWEEPIFSDNSGKPLKVTRSKEPGRFPQGETVVEYFATDYFGNTASCNITISIQKHACKLPIDPINGSANCTEDGSAVYCSLTCENGYAFAMRPNQDYFCAYDGIWHPASNPFPFPDCSVSSISNTISHSGEITMEDESGSICDDIFFMGQVENKIQTKLENALNDICFDDLCEISTVEAICESLLAEAEEEFNSLSYTRRRRDTHNLPHQAKWMVWKRGSPLESTSRKRFKRNIRSLSSHKVPNLMFPRGMFRTADLNETVSKQRDHGNSNFMGLLTGLIIQSLGKDIGLTRLSSFLASLGSNNGQPVGVNEFLAAFSKEFGEEKAKEVRLLAEKSMGQILDDHINDLEKGNSLENGLNHSNSSLENLRGSLEGFSQNTKRNVDALSAANPTVKQQEFTPILFPGNNNQGKKENEKKEVKIKFLIEGQVNNGSKVMSDAFQGLIKSAENGTFDLNFGEIQLRVAAIRLSEDPEFKCEPGSIFTGSQCVKCPAGTFFNVIMRDCQPCPAGSFQPKEGQVSCLVCPQNTSTKTGQAKSDAECKALCLPGSYSSDTLEPCITCSLGEYQDEYGSKSCSACPFETTTWRRGAWLIDECKTSCPPGKVSETGLEPCLPCPLNYFQSDSQQTNCFKCPVDSNTESTGSTSLSNCSGIPGEMQAAYTTFEILPINDCFSMPCKNGGLCNIAEFGYVCNCAPGYEGQHCEEEINECLSYPCLNNATCQNQLAGFKCLCSNGFEGDLCEINTNECEPKPCKNGATCIDIVNDFRCICESGFTGEKCEVNIDECAIAPCSQSSTCVDGISNYTCVCPLGFEGLHCTTEINECESSPCVHGTCQDLEASFKCICEEGYAGEKCDIDIDECENQPCKNNGSCTDWLNGFSCNCLPGFTGKICETKMSTDFVLEFSTSGIINYASLKGLQKPLYAVTVCFWMKTRDRENYGTPFSYATESHDNALTLTDYSGFVLYVNGEKRITDVSANDGEWHMICVLWEAEDGKWSIFKNSVEVDSGKGLSSGKHIKADGVLVIGQEQDQKGGKYSAPESFIGELTLLNVWGNVLPKDTLGSLFNKCSRYVGDIRSWPDFQSGIMGFVKLKSSSFCVGCAVPYSPQNGRVTANGTKPGDVAIVTCDEGYKLSEGDEERTCLLNGKWSGLEPECQAVSCRYPGQLRNGEVKGFNHNFGDLLHYNCNKGFQLVGSATRTCEAGGNWSGEKPECQIVTCPKPEPMENGVVVSHLGSYLPNNRVAYGCEDGYQMDGPDYQVCTEKGTWRGAPPSCQPSLCQQLPKVLHGTVTKSNTDHSIVKVTVTCEPGYKLKNGSSTVCQDGAWSQPIPKCVPKTCKKPPLIDNGNIKLRVSREGKQAKYRCHRGYVIEGPSLLTCTEDGVWDYPFPECLLQPCPVPEVPAHGIIPEKERWSVGDEVIYECKTGYAISGNGKKICKQGRRNGYWDGETPKCEIIICPNLNSLEAGTFRIIQKGIEEEEPMNVWGEIDLELRRRRSADDFPSFGSLSSNYDELEDFGGGSNQGDDFPLPSNTFGSDDSQRSGGFDYGLEIGGQTSGGFDYGGQRSGWDYGGQTSGFDYEGQKSGFDYDSQRSGSFDYGGQESEGFEDLDQSQHGFDVFSSPDYELIDSFDTQFSQFPDEPMVQGPYTYNTTAGYECKPGFRIIGAQIRRCTEQNKWDYPEPHCHRQYCPEVPSIENGYLTYMSAGDQLKIEFHCNVGFKVKGLTEVFCKLDGSWSGGVPTCEELSCEVPIEPANGTVTFDSTNKGAVAFYDCFRGFVLEGSFERHCQLKGFWNGSLPRCIEIACKAPAVIDNGYIYYEGSLSVGSIVEYGCNDCYELKGTVIRECQLDETWSLEEPSCEIIKCNVLPSDLENGKIMGGENSCGSLVEFECNPGYKLKGERKATCLDDSEWTSDVPTCSKVSCGNPPSLVNGNRIGNSFMFADQVKYECKEGYTKSGNDILTCSERGMWLGDIPQCTIIMCTKPTTPSNGRIRVAGLFYGSSIEIVCDPGFKMEGDNKLTCQSNGQWDTRMPFCSPLICPPAPRPEHSYYNSTELYFESFSYLSYGCHEGYTTTAENNILKCNALGQWAGKIIQCDPVVCGEPGLVKNAVVRGARFTLGETVEFTCLEGYEMFGDPKATCQPNGKWSEMPSCKKINCGSLPKLQHSTVKVDEPKGDFNTSAYYTCNDGYIMSGPSKITCLETGLWSNEIPTCSPVLCPEPPELVNAEIYGSIYKFNHKITFTCDNGHNMQGQPVLTCLKDGKWSSPFPVCEMIVCEKVQDIPYASWRTVRKSELPQKHQALTSRKSKKGRRRSKSSKIAKLTSLLEDQYDDLSFRFGHKVEYTCDEGYFKTTPGIMECTKGGWSSPPPQCHPILCPLPINITNGRVLGDDTKFGSVLSYECNEGYDLFGVSTRKCQANKEWTDSEPYCRAKECPRPAQIVNGRTIAESIKYQSVISYVCNPGFKLEGVETRVCQSDENWSGERPFCVEIFCETPKEIPYAAIEVSTLKVGGKVTYRCMEGYSIKGRALLNCQSDGTWDTKAPICLQVDCGPPPRGKHLVISGNETVYASKVVYSCDRGFDLDGVERSTCLQSGRWSHKAPRCERIMCEVPLPPDNGFIVTDGDGVVVLEKLTKEKKQKRRKGKQRGKSRAKYRTKTKEKLQKISYFVDDKITFDCNPGWEILGEGTLTCTINGEWSTKTPECIRISCGPPELPEHAVYSGSNFMYEEEIVISCDEGYVLRGNPVAKCAEDENWTHNALVCEPVTCGAPPRVENSDATYKIPGHGLPHHFDSLVTYSCHEGYILKGSSYMACEATGKWIGPKEAPRCVEMPCGPPPSVPFATAIENKNSKPQSVQYSCDPGYYPTGQSSAYCSLGRWKGLNTSCNPLNCQEPPIPSYGKITADNFQVGSVANYSCVKGHELIGNPSVLCGVEGHWIGETPKCRPVDCGEPKGFLNGNVSFTSSLFNSKVTYKCDDGYELKGDYIRICSPDGFWSGHLPQCHRISCGELQPPSNGFVIGVGQLYGDEVKFTCDKGHVLIGNETATCHADGKWSVTNQKCEGVRCPPPNPLMYADPLEGNTEDFVYGDKVFYSCQKGHIHRGDLSSECQNDGTWSRVKGQCSKISCGRPMINLDGAVILGRSFYYNDKVKISCPSGTNPKGSTFLTCLSDGSWSGEAACVSGCNNMCLNGGVCIGQNLCSCPAGFMGTRCQHATCVLPCLNGGTCVGPYKCKCISGYEGPRCQKPICENECGSYGKCIGPNVCLCQYGETAESCPEYTDYDYQNQYDETRFNDWDIALLRRRLGNHKE